MKKNFFLLPVFFLFAQCAKAQTLTNLAWQPYPLQVTEVPVGAGQSYLQIACFDSLLSQTQTDSTGIISNIMYENKDGLLVYMNQPGNAVKIISYDFEKHQFVDTTIENLSLTGNAFSILDGWVSCNLYDAASSIFENHFIRYDIVAGGFLHFTNTLNDFPFGGITDCFILSYSNNPLTTNSAWFNSGISGFNSPNSLLFDNILFEAKDGVLQLQNDNTGNPWVKYSAPDAQGFAGLNNPTSVNGILNQLFHTNSGIATYADDSSLTFAIVDTWLNQWVTASIGTQFPIVQTEYTGVVNGTAWAETLNGITGSRTLYAGVYNVLTHSWDVDSVSLDSIFQQGTQITFLNNGTAAWYELSGTIRYMGYDAATGWGNYQTTPRLDFCIKNMQSPSNHNLIFVRDYSIGYDSVLFDFGDGYATNRKASSHLYKTNGHYRMASNNYTVCATAGTQTVCKPVLFSTSTLNLQQPEFNIIVSPNPAHSSINISLSNFSSPVNATLTDITGRFVQQFKITSSSCIYDVTTLRKGIYFLKIDDVVKKVVVQ